MNIETDNVILIFSRYTKKIVRKGFVLLIKRLSHVDQSTAVTIKNFYSAFTKDKININFVHNRQFILLTRKREKIYNRLTK